MATTNISIPCMVDDTIYYPVESLPLPICPTVTEIRITRYGVINEAINNRTGETFRFPEIAFGKKVFSGEEGRKRAFEICEKQRNERRRRV